MIARSLGGVPLFYDVIRGHYGLGFNEEMAPRRGIMLWVADAGYVIILSLYSPLNAFYGHRMI